MGMYTAISGIPAKIFTDFTVKVALMFEQNNQIEGKM